jgi:hypothetical protein
MGKPENVYGEGNYDASRKYNEAAKKFAQSGKVDKAARDAAPSSDADALQMAAAEAEGRSHAKGEDPALTRKSPRKRAPAPGDADTPETAPEDSRAPKPGGEE